MKPTKPYIFALLFVLTMAFSLTACSGSNNNLDNSSGNNNTPSESKTVSFLYSANDYIGKDYQSISASLTEAGFTKVSALPIEDLDLIESDKEGNIESVSINGNNNFSTQDSFPTDSEVVISYHSLKTISVPLSSIEAKSMDIDSIMQMFANADIENIIINEEYDLDPDDADSEFINEVFINGNSVFEKGEKYPINANVSIVCHLPYEKYTVQMHINFISNLLFSKYGVKILLDGTEQYALEHGIDADHTYRLKEGTYTFTFLSAESSSIKSETTIEVCSDIDVSYRISCHSDKIVVETLYLDSKNTLAENEAKIMSSRSNFRGENYKDVIASLTEQGFTNIIEVPVYDIYFGITAEGSTKDVSIGGSIDYTRGNVFAKDIEIIVTYSLSYKDDPANASTEPPITTEPPTEPLAITEKPTEPPTTMEESTTALTGYHIQEYDNGDKYSGNFVNGVRSGQGTYEWANGTIYVGEFVNGNPSGKGEYIYPTEATTAPPKIVTQEIVYWVPNGEVYHSTNRCNTLSRSRDIRSGTIAESGKSRKCSRCY
ncbi:MAG: hypothetical protein FWF92_03660 [Oscillospiraceae bacterium]|nr:hypothetical protein [Oscillospiraceae bacterium]